MGASWSPNLRKSQCLKNERREMSFQANSNLVATSPNISFPVEARPILSNPLKSKRINSVKPLTRGFGEVDSYSKSFRFYTRHVLALQTMTRQTTPCQNVTRPYASCRDATEHFKNFHANRSDEMKNFICRKCGHSWIPRTQKPIKCPKCTSPNWRVSRVRPSSAESPQPS
jgi:Zn finger protein HypA/HybF involved in hydrogenase expression